MSASTAFSIVPLVGYDNVVRINDSGTVRPFLYDAGAATAYIMPKTTAITDGAGNDADVVPPAGRPGNMKTVLLVQLITQATPPSGAGVIELYCKVNIPSAMPGLVPQKYKDSTAWLNTANWPIVDYSKFAPRCAIRPVFHPDETLKTGATNPFLFNPSTPVDAITACQGGFISYFPGGWQDDVVFNPTSLNFSNVGPYGAALCRFYFAATLAQYNYFEISIDFSHSVSN